MKIVVIPTLMIINMLLKDTVMEQMRIHSTCFVRVFVRKVFVFKVQNHLVKIVMKQIFMLQEKVPLSLEELLKFQTRVYGKYRPY